MNAVIFLLLNNESTADSTNESKRRLRKENPRHCAKNRFRSAFWKKIRNLQNVETSLPYKIVSYIIVEQ